VKADSKAPQLLLVGLAFAVALPLLAQAPSSAPSRGALLYRTHCIACHDTQVHWRHNRLVTDWPSLSSQVRRWQANTGLQWTDEEIDEVVRYLNATIYKFPDQSSKQLG
jgi:mono/diheme cytochrome c family protein